MVTASDLKQGMALRIDQQIYRVVEVEARAAAAKMSGNIKVRLENVRSGRLWDQHYRPQEKLEDLPLERRPLEFLYSDGDFCTFLRLDNFEQVQFPASNLGLAGPLLQAGLEVPAEFFGGEPIHILLPDTLEARIATTTPPSRSQQDSGRKEATLDNGLIIQVPLFVATGETVSIDIRTGHYVERIRTHRKKGT